MKIAIVGAGAMGSLFGSMLSESANEVWLYDIRTEHVMAIDTVGLRIEWEGRTRIVRVNATDDPGKIKSADLVMVFVKSTQTAEVAETAARLAGTDGTLMTLQNGMGNADVLAKAVSASRIIAGSTSHGATMLGPGKIRHAGKGPTIIGGWDTDQTKQTRASDIADMFTRAGIETECVTDVRGVVWNKLLVNIGINAITALTGIKNGTIPDMDATRKLSRAAVEEAISVARALGVETRSDAVDHVYKIATDTSPNRSSMGQDVDNRRQTEIDAINGFIVREAERLGLKTPVNQTLTALIQTLQAHYG